MVMTRLIAFGLIVVGLAACAVTTPQSQKARILVMGDSLMASNGQSGEAVSDVIEQRLKQPVVDRAVPGARYLHFLPLSGAVGLKIPKQFVDRSWDWVVLNGYGNDILLGCGCRKCDRQMNRLISGDGQSGAIADFVRRIRATGARVIYTGYLRTPGFHSPVERCGLIGDQLDKRLALLAVQDRGVFFVGLSDLVPDGDRSYHAIDRVHPSRKGSQAIGARIADVIRKNK
jgi:hypothetical protein